MATETFDKAAFEAKRDTGIKNASLWQVTVFEIKQAYENGDTDLRYADLRYADLRYADLRYADLRCADLSCADLSCADLRDANLSCADLSDADLRDADLSCADLSCADLRDANLRNANLRDADLSGAKGLISAIDYMNQNFETNEHGYIVYKTFNSQYTAPNSWVIEPNSIITEVVNQTPTNDCACGINVAPFWWVQNNQENDSDIWKCLIEWKWLAGVTVPYHTEGKIRCERVRLLEIVSE